jgi:hypothetical protein
MANRTFNFKKILLGSLLACLWLPIFQSATKFIQVPELKGAIVTRPDTVFTIRNWIAGNWQTKMEEHLNDSFPLRPYFIRLHNQVAYALFNKAKANGVIIGKENYLFEKNYISAANGEDYIGDSATIVRMQQLDFIQDTLSKLGKHLMLIICPNKATYFKEFVPVDLIKSRAKTNYYELLNHVRKSNIKYIDFEALFLSQKHKLWPPLYPKYGIHWSEFSMLNATDSIIKYLENNLSLDLPNIKIEKPTLTVSSGEFDRDILLGMNLLFCPPFDTLQHANYSWPSGAKSLIQGAIVIADSYFWGLYNYKIETAFKKLEFWYYNSEAYSSTFPEGKLPIPIGLKKTFIDNDLFIIMGTPATMKNFGWGFIEKAYKHFTGKMNYDRDDPLFIDKVASLKRNMQGDPEWLTNITNKAKEKNISVDSMMTLDAIWLIENE